MVWISGSDSVIPPSKDKCLRLSPSTKAQTKPICVAAKASRDPIKFVSSLFGQKRKKNSVDIIIYGIQNHIKGSRAYFTISPVFSLNWIIYHQTSDQRHKFK